jgi:hypothetical protein
MWRQAGRLPTGEELAEMDQYQEEMVQAGVLLAGEGLRPTSLGARVTFVGGGEPPQVIDGPFTESKELIAGFSLIQVRSKAVAIEWASRAVPRGRAARDPAGLRGRRLRPERSDGRVARAGREAAAGVRAQGLKREARAAAYLAPCSRP